MNNSILESKLKRHKISYIEEDGIIVIGKPKTDYATLIGLVAFPIVAAVSFCLLMILNNIEFIGAHPGKITAGIIVLFGTGFFNLSRVMNKKESNENLKLLEPKVIKIKNELGEYIFDSKNINGFDYSAEQIGEETYSGNLYLIDDQKTKHQILGFDDEDEKYVLDDLKWFSDYFQNHIEINKPKS